MIDGPVDVRLISCRSRTMDEGRGWRDHLIADAEKMLRNAVGGAF